RQGSRNRPDHRRSRAAVLRRRRSAGGAGDSWMTRPLWTQDELSQTLGAPTAPLAGPASGVSIDTRTLKPGDLFIAIKGDTHDGHDHVGRAFEAGAVAALVSRTSAGGPQFVVEDSLRGM